MLLSDRDIKHAVARGSLKVTPFEEELVEAASLDVRLDRHFRVFNTHDHVCIDPAVKQDLTTLVEVYEFGGFVLAPGQFVLASTVETITLDRGLAAQLAGKSSLGRLGLQVHATAGFVDPGFSGQITLELSSVAPLPIRLWPGMRIGQLTFTSTLSPAAVPYGSPGRLSHYQGQAGPTPTRSHGHFRTWPTS